MSIFRCVGVICMVGLMGSGEGVFAAVACFDRGLGGFGKLTEKVAEYADSGTHRETVAGYADSHNLDPVTFAKKVEPTGRLICSGGESSANLVIKGDTLLCSNHPFMDRATCKKLADPTSCTFVIDGRGPLKISSLVTSGNKCPEMKGRDSDWAILKLEHVIEGVTPYKIKQMSARDGIDPQKILAVGASSADFRRFDKKTKRWTYPKHVQDCEIKKVYYVYNPLVVSSNCDGSNGKSGGALLASDLSEPTLIGITVGNSSTKFEEDSELKTGMPIRKMYDDKSWRDAGVAITGELYDSLKKATE